MVECDPDDGQLSYCRGNTVVDAYCNETGFAVERSTTVCAGATVCAENNGSAGCV
jgi:hypothetical protein